MRKKLDTHEYVMRWIRDVTRPHQRKRYVVLQVTILSIITSNLQFYCIDPVGFHIKSLPQRPIQNIQG